MTAPTPADAFERELAAAADALDDALFRVCAEEFVHATALLARAGMPVPEARAAAAALIAHRAQGAVLAVLAEVFPRDAERLLSRACSAAVAGASGREPGADA